MSDPTYSRISASDANAVDPVLGGPKIYGSQQTTINARDLQRDINSGAVSQDIQIVTNQQLVRELQGKVDVAQRRFDANPSRDNLKALESAQTNLGYTKRDGECLISTCIPVGYYSTPVGPVTPIAPLPSKPGK